MKRDIDWLRKSLAAALGWDEQLTEGVAEAIAAAGSKHEVDELTQVNRTSLKVRGERSACPGTWASIKSAVALTGLSWR